MAHLTMEIKSAVRQFIAENVLLGMHQTTIEDTTPLVTGGLIDSIGMIGLVTFLETRFKVEFVPREIDVHSLDTLEQIEELIQKKLASQKAGHRWQRAANLMRCRGVERLETTGTGTAGNVVSARMRAAQRGV